MEDKSWKQPLKKSFVKEGQGQHDRQKQVEVQQDQAKMASEEVEEVKFKPRGKDYAKALENQEEKDPEKHAASRQEKEDVDKEAMNDHEKKNLDRNAMSLKGKGWAGAKHNEHTLEYDPDAKWEEPSEAEKEAWEKKRKGQGYENR